MKPWSPSVMNTVEKRIDALRTEAQSRNIDTLMVLTAENRYYLSGYTGEDTQFDESAGALFISADNLILATDSRYNLQAESEAPLYEVVCYREGLATKLPEILKTLGTQTLGFEGARLSVYQYNQIKEKLESAKMRVELMAADSIFETFRVVKEEQEIKKIKDALGLAESVFENFIDSIYPGMTEHDAAWTMEKNMREAGAQSLAFPTITASGPNSALPHAIPGERAFQVGEPILFDWGARLNEYCSDISRTVIIGQPDITFNKVYLTVRNAQKMAIEAIKSGVSSKAVDNIARKYIESQGFKGKFGHGLGHGVGIGIHEAPRLSPLKDTMLQTGMVVTVEPGIYLPEWGGVRIENMVVVRDDGAEVLNRLDTELICLSP